MLAAKAQRWRRWRTRRKGNSLRASQNLTITDHGNFGGEFWHGQRPPLFWNAMILSIPHLLHPGPPHPNSSRGISLGCVHILCIRLMWENLVKFHDTRESRVRHETTRDVEESKLKAQTWYRKPVFRPLAYSNSTSPCFWSLLLPSLTFSRKQYAFYILLQCPHKSTLTIIDLRRYDKIWQNCRFPCIHVGREGGRKSSEHRQSRWFVAWQSGSNSCSRSTRQHGTTWDNIGQQYRGAAKAKLRTQKPRFHICAAGQGQEDGRHLNYDWTPIQTSLCLYHFLSIAMGMCTKWLSNWSNCCFENFFNVAGLVFFQVPSTDLSLSHYVPLGPHLPRQSRGNLLSKPVQQVRHPRPSRSTSTELLHMTIHMTIQNTTYKIHKSS